MRATIILIAMCAILGADAISLPSFEVGTWDLVDSDGLDELLFHVLFFPNPS